MSNSINICVGSTIVNLNKIYYPYSFPSNYSWCWKFKVIVYNDASISYNAKNISATLRLLSDSVALSFVQPIVIRKWRLIVNTYFQTLLLEKMQNINQVTSFTNRKYVSLCRSCNVKYCANIITATSLSM